MSKNAKNVTVAAVRFTAKQRELIASAATIGANVSEGFDKAVALFRDIGQKNGKAVTEAGNLYRAGYVSTSLLRVPAYAKRWGNLDGNGLIAAALEIIERASPDSSKTDRRTELEHKAVRAADVSLSTAKKRAGYVPTKAGNRKPRPAAKASTTAKAPPVDLVKASPRLTDKKAVNDYMATAAAALLATCNKNAKQVDPRISSAVTAFHDAMKQMGLISTKPE